MEAASLLPRRLKLKKKNLSFALLSLALLAGFFVGIILFMRRNRSVFFQTNPGEWSETSNLNLSSYFAATDPLFSTQPLIANRDSELAFFVISAPGHDVQRDQIRQTWAKKARKFGYPVTFVIGNQKSDSFHAILFSKIVFRNISGQSKMSLTSEMALHGDILLGNFLDSYMNLTLKTGFLLRYLNIGGLRSKFIIKVSPAFFV